MICGVVMDILETHFFKIKFTEYLKKKITSLPRLFVLISKSDKRNWLIVVNKHLTAVPDITSLKWLRQFVKHMCQSVSVSAGWRDGVKQHERFLKKKIRQKFL